MHAWLQLRLMHCFNWRCMGIISMPIALRNVIKELSRLSEGAMNLYYYHRNLYNTVEFWYQEHKYYYYLYRTLPAAFLNLEIQQEKSYIKVVWLQPVSSYNLFRKCSRESIYIIWTYLLHMSDSNQRILRCSLLDSFLARLQRQSISAAWALPNIILYLLPPPLLLLVLLSVLSFRVKIEGVKSA